MSAVTRNLYKPISVGISVLGGVVAGKIFTEIWQRISPTDEEPPNPKDLDRSGKEAILSAAVHGLVFGVVKAAIDRTAAKGYRAVANENPV
ncbi:DUF4235 domain-containing protein [Mycobacterium sp. MYCO198283]|uniref:DUF4235 domain-containing protein n=1 Tax=Mycobacterium sp. MYCO198283 TaxID=2883505 RepID=UPI001E5F835A|nr:DUF4235 domain-containing protein [Mycobacterium sp. MYCO198283]MCG5434408.1 DUF4235 domain-containing protein [Mycobacterium sp. MYCO198283]